MIKRAVLTFVMLFIILINPPVWAEDEMVQSPEVMWCTPDECYESSDDYVQAIKEQIIEENILPVTEEINKITSEIEILKRELNVQMKEETKVVNKDGILYSIIAILSILTLIFGIKAFKKK